MLRKTSAFLPLLLLPALATADVITRCGSSTGYSLYPESELVPKAKAGWIKDGISNGALQLVRDGNQFDVVYTDAQGTRSARSDGFQVIRVPGTTGHRYLLIGMNAASGVVEHWLFNLDAAGRGSVIWGSIRGGSTLPKSSLMEARCERP